MLLINHFNNHSAFASLFKRRLILKRHHANNIVIESSVVTPKLCLDLIKTNPILIRFIPPHLHTEDMYQLIYEKNKYVFLHFQMTSSLQSKYLDKLVEDNDIRYYQHTENNKNQYSVDNYVTEVTRHAYTLKYVPRDKQADVFEKLPHDFFTTDTLDQLHDCTILGHLFQHYFQNVALFYVTDRNTNGCISRFYVDKQSTTTWTNLPDHYYVWNPDLFLHAIHVNRDDVKIQTMDDMHYDKKLVSFYRHGYLTIE